MFRSLDPIMQAGVNLIRTVEIAHQRLADDVVNQRALSRSRHAGHTHKPAQRDVHGDVVQVVLPGANDGEPRQLSIAGINRLCEFASHLSGHSHLPSTLHTRSSPCPLSGGHATRPHIQPRRRQVPSPRQQLRQRSCFWTCCSLACTVCRARRSMAVISNRSIALRTGPRAWAR